LVMKGPETRECPPSLAFPELKASSVFQDAYPLLVTSEESLAAVGEAIRSAARNEQGVIGGLNQDRWKVGEVEMERFRPNIVVKGAGIPFSEEFMREIVVSSQPIQDPSQADSSKTITLIGKCARCLLPNVDTRTGIRDAAVPYKVMMKFHKDPKRMNKPIFGVNGAYGGDGIVRLGDYVEVRKWAREGEE